MSSLPKGDKYRQRSHSGLVSVFAVRFCVVREIVPHVDDKDLDKTGIYQFLSQFSLCVLTAGGSIADRLKRYWEAVEPR